MPIIRPQVLLWSLMTCLAMVGPKAAHAALITTAGNDITGLDITLAATPDTDTDTGTTTLSYDIALGTDPAAEWLIVGVTVLRDWTEGPYTGSPAVATPAGWAVDPSNHFVHWGAHTADVEIAEGESLGGFTYTFFGAPPTDQLFRYLVSKDGGTPFQVLSNEISVPPAAVVPEPAAAALIVLPVVGLLYRRRT